MTRRVWLVPHSGVLDTHCRFDVEVLVLPHPSGRSRMWNDRPLAARARAAVERLLAGRPA